MYKLIIIYLSYFCLSCQTAEPVLAGPSNSLYAKKNQLAESPAELFFEKIIGGQGEKKIELHCKIFTDSSDNRFFKLKKLWEKVKKSQLTTGMHIMPRIPSVEYYAVENGKREVIFYDHDTIKQRSAPEAKMLVKAIDERCEK